VTDRIIDRQELLAGTLPRRRRAQRFVGAIESRVLYMRDETHRALRAYFLGSFAEYERGLDRDYLAMIRERARSPHALLGSDLERFTPQWRMLVPAEAELRAGVLRELIRRLGLDLERTPNALRALGFDEAAVRDAYLELHGEAPEATARGSVRPPETVAAVDRDEEEALHAVEDRAEWLTLPGGERLMTEGEPSDALYLVVSGRFRVLARAHDSEIVVAEIGRGEVVGEMGALTGEPRSATIVAARDSEVIRLPQDLLLEVARATPELLLRINRELVRRLRVTTARSSSGPSATSYALVGAHPGAPVRAVARALRDALRSAGTTVLITGEEVEREFAPAAGEGMQVYRDPQLIAWLAEREARNRFVLYEGDAEPTPWTRRCIRQADRIILVADADASAGRSAIDEEIAAGAEQAEVELLLVHPAGRERPAGTARWLRERRVQAHHHLRLDDDRQVRHVARMLSGTGLGIALGGGGARGAAHIGVIRALQEHGYEPDAIGGTSMGALIGGEFALERDVEEVAERMLRIGQKRLLDWTLPLAAFTAGGTATAKMLDEFAETRIEDLWRPFFCVATNLTRAEELVHRQGPLWSAVRSSISIPGVFPPVLWRNGDLLVDGGIMNTLPIDRLRELRGIGTVIGSDVIPGREVADDYRFGGRVSGWRLALGAITRSPAVSAPSIVNTIIRANEVRAVALGRTQEFAAQADLIIHSPTEAVPTLDFAKCGVAIEAGYRAASEALEGWSPTAVGAGAGGSGATGVPA
jgi:predicted acylesterase/phospholipase RssA/CRP-like cAMP-binding protein